MVIGFVSIIKISWHQSLFSKGVFFRVLQSVGVVS